MLKWSVGPLKHLSKPQMFQDKHQTMDQTPYYERPCSTMPEPAKKKGDGGGNYVKYFISPESQVFFFRELAGS